jgi:DNA-binding IclR family transcriptional regulator
MTRGGAFETVLLIGCGDCGRDCFGGPWWPIDLLRKGYSRLRCGEIERHIVAGDDLRTKSRLSLRDTIRGPNLLEETKNARRGRPRKSGDDPVARRGVGALDHALDVLKALARSRGPATLSDISRAAGMPTTKVHRYLASFIDAGLVSQPERSGRYDLGQGALDLGLAALARNDIVNRVAGQLADLTDATGSTAMLSVWGGFGPTVVRWERSSTFIATTLGLGTTFPLLNSATGRVFLANLPDRLTRASVERELKALGANRADADFDSSPKGIERLKALVRRQGHATVEGRLIPGLKAASAPVLNWQGEAECAVTLIGSSRDVIDPQAAALPTLMRFVARFSMQQSA